MSRHSFRSLSVCLVATILTVCQVAPGIEADESIGSRPIRRPHYQPVFSRVVRAPEEETLSAIDEHDRVIVDEPTPQQYDLIYDAPEVIIPTSHRSNSNYARFSHGFFPWASIRPRTRLSDMTNVKLVGPKRGTSGIRLI